MTDWFTSRETYEREIAHPDDPDAKIKLTLRPLNAGDRAELQEMQIVGDDDGEGGHGTVSIARQQVHAVQLALVAWSLPEALSPDTIAQLEPKVFDRIYEHVSFGNPKTEQAKGTVEVLPLASAADEPERERSAGSVS
jgi:hypothetical protein